MSSNWKQYSCYPNGRAIAKNINHKKEKLNNKSMSTEKKWYAVYTRPKWEKKVAELLSRKRIENYCPLNKSIKQWSDRKKTIFEPLFTLMFLFT